MKTKHLVQSDLTIASYSQAVTDQRGILLVDKPTGPTSHDLVDWMRRVSGVRRVGHTGTLDPLASGLMIMLVGREYTKLQDQFLKMDKTYLVTAQLGITSDSYDITGSVMTKNDNWQNLKKENFENVVNQFVGQIEQTVPIYSAVKIKGEKLYDLARRGQADQVGLPARSVTIYSLKITNFSLPHFTLEVSCSSGTYIRSLIHDIGQTLGVGAVVTALRRTQISDYSINQAGVCPIFKKRMIAGQTKIENA